VSDRDRWIVKPGAALSLADRDPRDTTGAPGSKKETKALLEDLGTALAGLQERLYAESKQALLVVLQAIDAGGKDGTVKHVFRGVNPQGVRVTSFKQPSPEELAHDFLWRIHANVPPPGYLGIFNRSQYEDVLIVRVHDLVPESVWRPRYHHINHFEALLHDADIRVIKLFLHISREEQAERLRARLADPTKQWKFNPADPRRARPLGRVPGRLRGGHSPDLDRARPVVRDPGRPQVVPQLGRQPRRDRDPRGHGPALSRARGGPRRHHDHVRESAVPRDLPPAHPRRPRLRVLPRR
jgi:PPK2 family polyphosphate:nucleotide phosphotransferase